MAKTGKITKSTFKNEWKGANGTVFYHEVEIEGDGAWQIGSKDKEPDFLKVGQTLSYEVKDAAKRSITRVKEFNGGGGFGVGGYKPDTIGITVGAALNQTAQLVSAGVVKFEDFKKVAHRLTEVALELKEEFAGK